MKALIIDDMPLNRQLFREILTPFHCKIVEAADGHQGFLMSQDPEIDLIFLDYQMPIWTGFDFLTHYKGQKPVIMMSQIQSRNEEGIEKYGAYGWVHKPPLLEEIEQLLSVLGLIGEGA